MFLFPCGCPYYLQNRQTSFNILFMNILSLTATPQFCILISRYPQQQHGGKENFAVETLVLQLNRETCNSDGLQVPRKKNYFFLVTCTVSNKIWHPSKIYICFLHGILNVPTLRVVFLDYVILL